MTGDPPIRQRVRRTRLAPSVVSLAAIVVICVAGAITIVTIVLSERLSRTSLAAVLGAIYGLAVTAVLSVLVGIAAGFTGAPAGELAFMSYVGASLPAIVLLILAAEPTVLTLNREVLALEIVRTLTGSLGIVAAMPITTAIATLLVGSRPSVSIG